MLLSLPTPIQHYLVEVSIWLADLMLLKVVGYQGPYLNRLTGESEVVSVGETSAVIRSHGRRFRSCRSG